MTVQSSLNRIEYTASGTQTTFAYPFRILDATHLQVYVLTSGVAVRKNLITDYTVTGVGTTAGGSVIFGTAPAASAIVILRRNVPLTQLTDYVENDPFPAETHENVADKGIMIDQQLLEIMGRAVVLAVTSLKSGISLPEPVDTTSLYLKWKSDGTGLELGNLGSVAVALPIAVISGGTGQTSLVAGALAFLGSLLTTKGQLLGRDLSGPVALGPGSNDQLLVYDDTQPTGLRWGASIAGFSDPTTTKGDLIARGAGAPATRLAIGANDLALLADSTAALGMAWKAIVLASLFTTKGDLVARSATGPVRMGVGLDGQVLGADSSQATGLRWVSSTGKMLFGATVAEADLPGGTSYLSPFGNGAPIVTESLTKFRVPFGLTCRNLRVNATLSGGSLTLRVRKNGLDTSLVVTMTTAATTGSDLVNTASFTAGEEIGVQLISASAAVLGFVTVAWEGQPT